MTPEAEALLAAVVTILLCLCGGIGYWCKQGRLRGHTAQSKYDPIAVE